MLMEGRPCSIREIKENIPENYWEKILYIHLRAYVSQFEEYRCCREKGRGSGSIANFTGWRVRKKEFYAKEEGSGIAIFQGLHVAFISIS